MNESFKLAIEAWESAWEEYVNALDAFDNVHPGEDFVIDCGRAGVRLNDAKNALRVLDSEFCKTLGI
jgi:hypothetical protein